MELDLLVIGGGVIGLSCALHAADLAPRKRIAVLDRPTNAGVASRAAAGMLAPFAEFAADTPLFRMCLASLDYYPEFLARFAPGVSLEGRGTLLPDDPAEPGRLESRAALAAAHGREARLIEGAALRALEPGLAPSVRRALLLPERLVDPRQLHDALRQSALALGVGLLDDTPVEARVEGDRVGELSTFAGASITAREVLLATGAWSAKAGALFGIDIPMTPVKGQVMQFAAGAVPLAHTIHTHGVYLAPRGGTVIAGATMEEAGFDPSLSTRANRDMAAAAAALWPPLAELDLLDAWTGFRPRTADGQPVIARSGVLANLSVATGHFRNGILLAPLTGRLAARLLS
ncbi:MAG: FAD-dependent oxidoreductase [Candidatus Sumerlaeia bacterium]|nr:FAD-dependent oxidoreductase [Candidatus Sumerlaeia bacterium]